LSIVCLLLLLLAEFLFWSSFEACAADVNGVVELSGLLGCAAAAM
jgi:hypothetical protein